ncbi:hypothetical protein LTR59_011058 [Friedmanniomyces endolithicus]|nr:hypothetical protein LTR94_007574 [Friedmanniomyces endolithicus]KAK0785334.1 hypothetical protein LTR59_011058 [Friedmanniomyces endolithicus]KAK0812348.1 hypothetical protein LTR38_003370 [Friedmanniomyces endolithicus]
MDTLMMPAKCPDCNQSLDNTPTQTLRQHDQQPGAPLETESDTMDNSQFHSEVTALGAFLSIFQGGLLAPTRTTYDSIDQLLNAPTKAERDELTKRWCDHKLEELNFVGVVGALLTGCLTSTGSGVESPWIVRTCWYCGIVFSLFAVLTAAQQSIRLHRMSTHRDAWRNIRLFMGAKYRDEEGVVRIRPRRFQVFGWQASIMFLTFSVLTMVLGMCLLVWTATIKGPLQTGGWWSNNAKLAVTWSSVTVATIIVFLFAQISLTMREDVKT